MSSPGIDSFKNVDNYTDTMYRYLNWTNNHSATDNFERTVYVAGALMFHLIQIHVAVMCLPIAERRIARKKK